MGVVAAGECSCVTDGWFPSPMVILLIVAGLVAGSVVAALRLRRRVGDQSDAGDDRPPLVTRVGVVTLRSARRPQPEHSAEVGAVATCHNLAEPEPEAPIAAAQSYDGM